MPKQEVVLRELTVPVHGWPAGLAGLRIAHVSDFHFSRWTRVAKAAQTTLANTDYDLLAVTGDFADFRRKWRRAACLTRRFLEPLARQGPVYAVLGNHDDRRLADECGPSVVFLNDRSTTVQYGDMRFDLAGVDQSVPWGGSIENTLLNGRSIRPTVLLAHYPSTAFRLPEGRVQLLLSGHTHGGQIRLPWLGCLWPNDRIPRTSSRGLQIIARTTVHISPGIGVSLPLRLRINCPPEVAVLTLHPADIGLAAAEGLAAQVPRRHLAGSAI